MLFNLERVSGENWTMKEMHESNRRHWDEAAERWESLRDEDGLWQLCPQEPELAFVGGAFGLIEEVAGSARGKDVCIIGSGDNYAAFALSGLGANVTSIDISSRQLEVAAKRANQLNLSITFVQADAARLESIGDSKFDLVCSSNGFFVWIADLRAVFDETYRVLRPGGHYVFCDVHPFQRPLEDQTLPLKVWKSYWDTGPFEDERSNTFEFHWTLSDVLNSAIASGFVLRRMLEHPAQDSRFWQGGSYLPGTQETLSDWTNNPLAALPVWLSVALQRPLQH